MSFFRKLLSVKFVLPLLITVYAVIFFDLGSLLAQSNNVTVKVFWDSQLQEIPESLHSVNISGGIDPKIAEKQEYRDGLDYMAPKFIRFHSASMWKEGSSKSWLDFKKQSLNVDAAASTIAKLYNPNLQSAMVNIYSLPKWINSNETEKFANFCASWVKELNVKRGLNIKYWELFNEREYLGGETLGRLFLTARDKMKAIDPSIQVGGVAFTHPYHQAIEPFLNVVGDNIDFLSYHNYAAKDGNNWSYLVGKASKMVEASVNFNQRLKQRGLNIPLYVDEYNLFWNWRSDKNISLMRGIKGALFQSLIFKYSASLDGSDGFFVWNEQDKNYGLMDEKFNVRPAGDLFYLVSRYLNGKSFRSSSSDTKSIETLAVMQDDRARVLLINISDKDKKVTLKSFGNSFNQKSVELLTIDENGLKSNILDSGKQITIEKQSISLMLKD